MNPVISVLISVHNNRETIRKSVESILAQTFLDFECIVIDDGSSDGTDAVLEGMRDSRLRVIRQENQGLTNALNRGLSMARGEYIARQDADDYSLPERLERQHAFLSTHPDIGVLGTSYSDVDASSGHVLRDNVCRLSPDEIRAALIRRNIFCHSSIMFRKSLAAAVEGYDETYRFAQDYKFYFDALLHARIGMLPEVLVYKTRSGKDLSARHTRAQRWYAIRARATAISRKQYPYSQFMYLTPALGAQLLPVKLKRWLDKTRYGF